MDERRLQLTEGWQVGLVDDAALCGEITRFSELKVEKVPATVPGDWVLDYVRAGKLEEPYYQDNYLKIQDYEGHHVFYGTTFQWEGGAQRVELEFEGIDTVADVYLNGQKIGHAENMYIPHTFAADGLRPGENELMVHILPAVLEARKYPISMFSDTLKYNYPALVIRKATHMFGWDICPRIVSSGLWRGVSVVQRKAEYVRDAFAWVNQIQADGSLRCSLGYELELGRECAQRYSLRVEGVSGDSRFAAETSLWHTFGRLHFSVEKPRLWWPRGYGEPAQYDISVILLRDGEEIDRLNLRQGLRTAELIHDDTLDEKGEGEFCFVINGRRVYIKGTNWVPVDAFHSNDEARTPGIIELVKDVGCNAMRVWGGGVYESELFYNLCDENGILIWQDFMMACGVYPQTERMKRQLEDEVRSTVRRLRRHACICLWAGDNECDQNYCWGDNRRDPSLNVLTRGVIPAVLRDEDCSRPYLPSSPYVSSEAFRQGRQQETPEQHLWGPRDYFKSHFYHDHSATFASEMGYHGCNSPKSLKRFLGDRTWPVDGNPMYLYHAASPELGEAPYNYRIPLMSGQMKTLFGQEPRNLDEYARMSQISQAEAKKYFVESFRCRKGRRTGLIWWNIMDCWPQISDAVVDYYFCRKLAYFFIRRSQQPVCLMMDDHTGENVVYGVSDRFEDCAVHYKVTDVETERVVAEADDVLRADASTPLIAVRDDGGAHFYLIEWETADGEKGRNHYLQGRPSCDYAWYLRCLKQAGFDEFEGFGED